MAVTFVAAGASDSAGAPADQRDITPGLPAGWAENDIFVATVQTRAADSSGVATPADWTEIDNIANATSTGWPRLQVFWRRATSSESAPTFATSTLNNASAIITAWRGVKTSGNPWNVKLVTADTGGNPTITIDGVTTTLPNCMIVAMAASNDNAAFADWSNATLESITEAYAFVHSFGTDGAQGGVYGILASAGSSGDITASNAQPSTAALTLALEPEGAAGPTISFPAIGTAGMQLAFTVSEACSRGVNYSDAHFSATGSVSGAIGMTYVSGDGTTTFAYSLDKTVLQGETVTFSYAQPGDGLEADSDGADVASFTDVSVTNNSTETGGGGTVIPTYYRILLGGFGGGGGVSAQAITGISWNAGSRIQAAVGSDNWPACWSDDGHQYAFWGDGGGFGGTNTDGRVSFGVARIEGDFDTYTGVNRYGDTTAGQTWTAEFESSIDGKSHGAPISIGGNIYCWVTPTSGVSGYASMTLHKSTNKCASFTTPGVQFTNATHGIAFGGFVNHGQDNEHGDGFVYVLAIEVKSATNLANLHDKIHLLRVPTANIETQGSYEWWTGSGWGNQASRAAVYESTGAIGSFPQMIYVPGLSRYVLTIETGGFSSDLRVLEASKPWGTWTLVDEFTDWHSAHGGSSTLFQWNFMPKWFRNGGMDFTMSYSGTGAGGDQWNSIDGSFSVN